MVVVARVRVRGSVHPSLDHLLVGLYLHGCVACTTAGPCVLLLLGCQGLVVLAMRLSAEVILLVLLVVLLLAGLLLRRVVPVHHLLRPLLLLLARALHHVCASVAAAWLVVLVVRGDGSHLLLLLIVRVVAHMHIYLLLLVNGATTSFRLPAKVLVLRVLTHVRVVQVCLPSLVQLIAVALHFAH